MTNDPASIAAALRTLAVYAICFVLAIVLGVLMTNPMTYSSLGFVAVLCAFMCLPILLRWHHPLLIIAWNSPIMCFFIKGNPKLCLVMITVSLAISVVERTLNQRRFIQVPQVTWPLLALLAIVVITAKLSGGIGLKAFGSDVYGGKKYIFLMVGILGYFALTAIPIPPKKASKYVALYFLGGTLSFIADLYQVSPGFLHPLFWFIPPMAMNDSFELGTTRLIGTAWGATAAVNALIARYGLRGIFLSDSVWRPAAFFLSLLLIFFGGFRSALVDTAAIIIIQFFLEGLHRTRLMPFFVLLCLAGMAAIIPLAPKLPYTFQRTLAFLPSNIVHLSADARMDAQASSDWRYEMWAGLLPQVPKHLLLRKGYTINMNDYSEMGQSSALRSVDPGQQALALSSDYHSGPFSVILPFGIWGVIAFIWFLIASNRVVYLNYRYGDLALHTVNTFLFTTYIFATFAFIFIVGDLSSGIAGFTAVLGLSVCINRGVCRVPKAPARNIPFSMRFANARSRPQPAFQHRTIGSRPI